MELKQGRRTDFSLSYFSYQYPLALKQIDSRIKRMRRILTVLTSVFYRENPRIRLIRAAIPTLSVRQAISDQDRLKSVLLLLLNHFGSESR